MPNVTPSSKKPSNSWSELPRPSRNPKRFASAKKLPLTRVTSAGGIIYRRKADGLEFFFIRDGHGRWTFPKGKQNLGETLAETAIREIGEETGLKGLRYIAPLGNTSFRFRRESGLIEKTVHYFLFEAPTDAKEHLPGVEGITMAGWYATSRVFSISGYRNLDRLLARALRLTTAEDTG